MDELQQCPTNYFNTLVFVRHGSHDEVIFGHATTIAQQLHTLTVVPGCELSICKTWDTTNACALDVLTQQMLPCKQDNGWYFISTTFAFDQLFASLTRDMQALRLCCSLQRLMYHIPRQVITCQLHFDPIHTLHNTNVLFIRNLQTGHVCFRPTHVALMMARHKRFNGQVSIEAELCTHNGQALLVLAQLLSPYVIPLLICSEVAQAADQVPSGESWYNLPHWIDYKLVFSTMHQELNASNNLIYLGHADHHGTTTQSHGTTSSTTPRGAIDASSVPRTTMLGDQRHYLHAADYIHLHNDDGDTSDESDESDACMTRHNQESKTVGHANECTESYEGETTCEDDEWQLSRDHVRANKANKGQTDQADIDNHEKHQIQHLAHQEQLRYMKGQIQHYQRALVTAQDHHTQKVNHIQRMFVFQQQLGGHKRRRQE
jgi:hypothetical protein